MTLAYMLVTGTYMLLGGAFYVCFPLPKWCIEDVSSLFPCSSFEINMFCILESPK